MNLRHLAPAAVLMAATCMPALHAAPAPAPARGSVALRVQRSAGSLDLVIEGTGAAPVLQQNRAGDTWQGVLRIDAPGALKYGPQNLTLPDAGLQKVSLDGSGSDYRIEVVPVPGMPLARPVVSADGSNLVIRFRGSAQPLSQTAQPDLRMPGRVPQAQFAPPLQPRAVAPPLGDMAVGSMVVRNRSYLRVSGPPVTMTMKNAPARDVLMALARIGGYGMAFVEGTGGDGAPLPTPPVTLSFAGEPYERAFNTVLLASGLQGRMEPGSSTLFVGPNVLSKTLGSSMSKVFRLNQASASSAADYLASLGAQINKINTISNVVSTGQSQSNQVQGAPAATQTQTQTERTIETYGASQGPLQGLIGTIDTRLQTITVVGDPQLVAIAGNYLRQIDLRQRQVALSVKILDVNLTNVNEIDNSFAFRSGNNFIVNDQGRLLAAFGGNLPSRAGEFGQEEMTGRSRNADRSQSNTRGSQRDANSSSLGSSGSATSTSSGEDRVESDTYTLSDDLTTTELTNVNNVLTKQFNTVVFQDATGGFQSRQIDDNLVTNDDNASNVASVINAITGKSISLTKNNSTLATTSSDRSRNTGRNASRSNNRNGSSSRGQTSNSAYDYARRPNPGLNYPDNEFYDFLQAQITSSSTKILASPTLILQEGAELYGGSDDERISTDGKVGREATNEGFVRVGTQFVVGYDVKQDVNGNNFCQPVFGNAGLSFGARVDKIDDNGFVTFGLSPEISAAVGEQNIGGGCGAITLINNRQLDTGKVRVRDGQTLILTGVISDDDRTVVSKWPILGDLPLIGQFFRRTQGTRAKSELVIMVTPRIINDDNGGEYGYGYRPETQAARSMVYSTN